MANPIIKIKTGSKDAYGNNSYMSNSEYMEPLLDGELAYNAYNNGLYIGYNGRNHLLSVANQYLKPEETQTFYGTASNALIAAKLGSGNVGKSSQPIYLKSGSPTAINSVAIEYGGTGATDVAAARENLGITSITNDLQDQINTKGIHYIIGNGTKEGVWAGTCDDITEYYDGLLIAYKINVAGASNPATSLNINNLGAKTVKLNNNTALTTHYPVGSILLLTYSASDNFFKIANYDSNNKVSIYREDGSGTDIYPLLFHYTQTGSLTQEDGKSTTAYAKFNNSLTVDPKTGTLTATKFTGTDFDGTNFSASGDYSVADNHGLVGEGVLNIKSASTLYLDRGSSASLIFQKGETEHARFDTSGHFIPGTGSYNIGSTSKKWQNIYATTFNGNLNGVANVATLLGTVTKGGSTKPIYLSNGSPEECGDTLDVNISGTANDATSWTNSVKFKINGTAGTTGTFVKGNETNDVSLILPTTLSGFTSIGATTFNGNLSGTANVAIKLGTVNKGDSNTPIYLDGGEPKAVTGLDLDTTGNAATADIWKTTRIFSISGTASDITSHNVNGSSNITLTLPKTLSGFTSLSADAFTGGVWNGTTVAVAYGGTGNTSQTANRLIYSENASKLSSSGHYASLSKIAINSTTEPTETLYVNGSSKMAGNITVNPGIISIVKDGNPYIHLSDGANNWYYQSVKDENKVGLGPTWTKATKWDTDGNVSMPASLSVIKDLNVSETATVTGLITGSGGLYVSGRAANGGDDEGIVVAPASNSYAGITLGAASGIRTTLYLLPSGNAHRSVWRYNNGAGTYNITHPETNGEVVVHTADTAQGSETLPVYVADSGVVTPCVASSVFSDFSSTAGASGETLSITVAGQTRTVTLDAANTSQGGVVTTGTQTFAGQKTFNGDIYGSHILPRTDMGYSLGNTSYTWKSIHSHGITLYDGTNGYEGGSIYTTSSNATTAQSSYVILGNGTSTGVAGNRYGMLRLYTEGAPYFDLRAHRYSTNSTSAAATTGRVHYLRDHGKSEAYLAATTTRDQVGSGTKPVYVSNAGVLTESSSTVGASAKPIYLSSGTLTESSSTLGATDTPIYMSAGELKACSSSKGSASVPVYMSNGQILQCTASSVFSSFTSSTNTLSITVCGQTRTASIVNSISNTWTGGTTAGPTLKTTVNGVAGTAVAIPVATASASGVVTTGSQTFGGSKTINGNLTVTASDDTYRTVYASNSNGTVALHAATNRGLYDSTGSQWMIYREKGATQTIIPGSLETPRIHLTSTTDAAPGSVTNCAITIGSTSGTHLLIDNNEILAKTAADTSGPLYLNNNVTVYNQEGPAMDVAGRADLGCLVLTNTGWTGWGTGGTSGLTAVTGRVYFKLI